MEALCRLRSSAQPSVAPANHAAAADQSTASARDLLPILAARLPQATVQVLPGLGHMAPVTHPERENPLIVDFLQRQTMLGS